MLEIILLIGLLCVFGIVVLMHVAGTADIPLLREISGFDSDPTLHPWFLFVEAVLVSCGIYICQHMSF